MQALTVAFHGGQETLQSVMSLSPTAANSISAEGLVSSHHVLSFKEELCHQWATALPNAPLKQLSLPISHLEVRVVLRHQPC